MAKPPFPTPPSLSVVQPSDAQAYPQGVLRASGLVFPLDSIRYQMLPVESMRAMMTHGLEVHAPVKVLNGPWDSLRINVSAIVNEENDDALAVAAFTQTLIEALELVPRLRAAQRRAQEAEKAMNDAGSNLLDAKAEVDSIISGQVWKKS